MVSVVVPRENERLSKIAFLGELDTDVHADLMLNGIPSLNIKPDDLMFYREESSSSIEPETPTGNDHETIKMLDELCGNYEPGQFFSCIAVGFGKINNSPHPQSFIKLWLLRTDCWPVDEPKPPTKLFGYPVILSQGRIIEL